MLFGQQARNSGEAPVLVRLMELGRTKAFGMQNLLQVKQVFFVADGEVNVRGMMVRWTTVRKSVFDCGMAGLNGLLGERNVASGNGVQVRFDRLGRPFESGSRNLGVHGMFRVVVE